MNLVLNVVRKREFGAYYWSSSYIYSDGAQRIFFEYILLSASHLLYHRYLCRRSHQCNNWRCYEESKLGECTCDADDVTYGVYGYDRCWNHPNHGDR
uniref:EGF-like domain-containing protein n=1 Tax=Heterorhabditis bacteriophora TaxID=37862 RepID=A0A1I7WCM3_HETBA